MWDIVGRPFELFFEWIRGRFSWAWAFVVAYVITPIKWIIEAIQWFLDWVDKLIDQLKLAIENTGVLAAGDAVASLGYYLGILNNFFPVALAFQTLMGLISLWILCRLIRIVLRFIPFLGK